MYPKKGTFQISRGTLKIINLTIFNKDFLLQPIISTQTPKYMHVCSCEVSQFWLLEDIVSSSLCLWGTHFMKFNAHAVVITAYKFIDAFFIDASI